MHSYTQASGTSLFDCAFLAHGDDGHSRVVAMRRAPPGSATPLDIGIRLACESRLSALWCSPTGQVWVTERAGAVWHSRGLWGESAGQWTQQTVDLVPDGVVGLDDTAVFVWGTRVSDGACLVRGWDGRAYKPFPSPGFAVRAMDVRRGLVAVGDGGWLARLDGTTWTTVHTGTDAAGLCVDASNDQVLVGTDDGRVLSGDLGGFQTRYEHPGPVLAVARWRGSVWAGCGRHGLLRDGQLARADRRCSRLEAHEELLIGCDDVVCSSPDGQRFPAAGRGVVDDLLQS